ncbi:MAG: pseudouridine synthase [Burkholderiaceae bacterium]
MLQFLVRRLPAVPESAWMDRMARREVVSEYGEAITPEMLLQPGVRIYYYRELPHEPLLPFLETVVYRDEHLLVADKPHFMPVIPTGRYLQRSLLVRLRKQWDLPDLSPLHRIDRDTAGLVLFSVQRATRGVYQALFRERAIRKTYEAVAALSMRPWPAEYESRIEESAQFFRMQEVSGPPNSLTRIALLDRCGPWGLFQLEPVTGRRHQLRVHMAALGMPLRHDPFYPVVNDPPEGDYSRPLQLLARSLEFRDPLTGQPRAYRSQRSLLWPPEVHPI